MTPAESLARSIAVEAHAGQVDKAGQPYIGHVERVVARLDDPLDRAVAWLHDVVEDTPVNHSVLLDKGLRAPGFRGKDVQQWVDVLACVRALTHRPNEERARYYDRVKAAGPRAVRVKLADIADNADPVRLAELERVLNAAGKDGTKTRVRLEGKYAKAVAALTGQDERRPGQDLVDAIHDSMDWFDQTARRALTKEEQ